MRCARDGAAQRGDLHHGAARGPRRLGDSGDADYELPVVGESELLLASNEERSPPMEKPIGVILGM